MSSGPSGSGATGEVLLDAHFDRRVMSYGRLLITGFLFITVAGILLVPFWLIFSLWYLPELYRRQSARLTARAIETRKGVFFRKEATIPLNRITDVRLHDGPLMRFFGLRGLRVETAGQSGQNASSEGDLVGVVGAVELRDAILRQREMALGGEAASAPAPAAAGSVETTELLAEIRDILTRIERQGRS